MGGGAGAAGAKQLLASGQFPDLMIAVSPGPLWAGILGSELYARHSQRADLPRGVDLERLPRPADHPRSQPGTTITTGIYRAISQYQADFGHRLRPDVLATCQC